MAIGEDEFSIIVTGMRFSFEHFGFYSPSRLVLHWMEELIMELLLVENVWCHISKVGPFCICFVVVCLVLVYGEIRGALFPLS